MTTMQREGYVATIDRDGEAELFHGEVINAHDVLTFQGRTFDELWAAIADTIADHVECCRELWKMPERPYSGNSTVRVTPGLHRCIAANFAMAGKSINVFVAETLERSALND